MSKYKNQLVKNLKDKQVRSHSLDERLKQVERAEKLLSELNPDREYRWEDIYKRITEKRNRPVSHETISGIEALHDVRLLAEDLSDSADLPAENAGEPVLTMEEVSRKFNVSTKTVERWRDRGLASRRFKFGNRKRIGFLQSSIDRFVVEHADEVERGKRFSQMTEDERQEILRQAQRLATSGIGPGEVTRRVALEFNRSIEAIRYTLKNHDKQNPQAAIFPRAAGSLTENMKDEIYRRARRGIPVKELASEFYRRPSEIERLVHQKRVEELWEQPIDYVYNEEFEAPDAEEKILGPVPEGTQRKSPARAPAGLPPYLASLYEVPLLTKDQEVYYFRKMNFLKFKAARLRDQLDPQQVEPQDLDRLESLLNQATETKNLLIRRNLRLVVSVAKKYVKAGSNFFEMVSDGNVSLMRAIEKFDYSRGFKLSTYATWAIRKNFARSIPAEHTQLQRFRTGHDEMFQSSHSERNDHYEREQNNLRYKEALSGLLKDLNERERNILITRYGLAKGTEPQTLEQVGKCFGVTKERIRQLEKRALRKLHQKALEEKIDLPGIQ